jgi:ADP-ribosyl-[dinitrogen reductase] hydrolase
MDLKDSIIGCILGGAIGDALGVPYEGSKPPIKIQRRTELIISDDTQLTLATCESISELGAVSPAAIAGRLAVWFKKGRIKGVGASTLKALQELSIGGHWALVGRKGEMGAGNGAAMRTAPLAFCIDPIDLGAESCSGTYAALLTTTTTRMWEHSRWYWLYNSLRRAIGRKASAW